MQSGSTIIDVVPGVGTFKINAPTDDLATAALGFCKTQVPPCLTDAQFDAAIDALTTVAQLRALLKMIAKSLVKVG